MEKRAVLCRPHLVEQGQEEEGEYIKIFFSPPDEAEKIWVHISLEKDDPIKYLSE